MNAHTPVPAELPSTMTVAPPSLLSVCGLAVAAAAYFSLSSTVTLEWVDEGQLVYEAWQVAQGGVPHRDFQHLYGPSVFLLNGLLLRLFGNDLFVIRVSLVALKAIASGVVYLAARRVASPRFAFIAFLSMVVVWGGPWWVFNTPYANHYALTLGLIGAVLYLRFGGRTGGALAGVCCGLAATFKQTTGLFALTALILFLSWDATRQVRASSPPASRAGQILRILAVVASFALCAGYLASNDTLWNVLVLFGPLAFAIAVILAREARHGAAAGACNVDVMIAAGLGMALPLSVCVAVYVAYGALGDLIASTIRGLPQTVQWFFAVASPDIRSSLLALTMLGVLVGAFQHTRRRGIAFVAASIGFASAILSLVIVIRSPGIVAYVQQQAWIGDVFRLVFLLPFVAIWTSMFSLVASRPSRRDDESDSRPQVLLTLLAASGLLSLYPAADFWHLIMAWPVFVPTLAWQLERLCWAPSGRIQPLAVAVASSLLLVCAAPFVHALIVARVTRPARFEGLVRASHITDGTQKFRDAVALVRFLDGQPADRRLLSLGEGQMLYYLAGRRSILEREEFILYLVGTGFVADADAHVLLRQPDAIARIDDAKPIIVVVDNSAFTGRLRRVFGDLSAYIDAHYQTVATFGAYRVLRWSAA